MAATRTQLAERNGHPDTPAVRLTRADQLQAQREALEAAYQTGVLTAEEYGTALKRWRLATSGRPTTWPAPWKRPNNPQRRNRNVPTRRIGIRL